MKILIRSHHSLHALGISGGAQRLMQNIGTALASQGWDVEILCPQPRKDGGQFSNSITFNEFEYCNPDTPLQTFANMWRGWNQFRQITDDAEFDIILDDISHYPFYPAYFFCPDDAVNVSFLHLALFDSAREFNGLLKGSMINLIDRTLPKLNSPEIVCAGSSTQKRLHKNLHYRHTHVLNPCIRPEEFSYQFDPDSNTILYLGRLGPRKNISCLLKAWKIFENTTENSNYRLVVAGKGGDEIDLRKMARRLSLDRVNFLGYVSENEKRQLLSESLLYVLPSKMEGYVTTGLEALASGTPIVGSNTYGINDYVESGRTGYLFPPNDHTKLASLLNNLTSDPAALEIVARRGRSLAERHSYENFVTEADDIFTKIANKNKNESRK